MKRVERSKEGVLDNIFRIRSSYLFSGLVDRWKYEWKNVIVAAWKSNRIIIIIIKFILQKNKMKKYECNKHTEIRNLKNRDDCFKVFR